MPSLQIGSKVGSYEILALVGVGGMGEVYRARDTKLKRDVAIKALPTECSRDPERLARAQREAELLASLNHPNIAQIYGQEEAGGALCLVLEFVEGETLHERIQRGAVPVDEALEIARQIAEALEAAHERGVVHRDLKPANVKINPSGQAKVLDFGLAKLRGGEASSSAALTNSPTMAPGGTLQGVILGTAAYMAPEQAKGKDADTRSDIWAFGVVLYEMLAGKSVFAGDTMVEVLGGVLKSDPEWHALPATTPPAVRALLRRCLQKDRKRRLHHIADARIEIEEALHGPALSVATVAPSNTSRERLAWVGGLLIAIATTAAVAIYLRPAPAAAPEVRFQINTPGVNLGNNQSLSFAISPDGRSLVFRATVDGKSQLWLRSLNSESAQPLAGTENAVFPFWSTDSRSVAFLANEKLRRIEIAGGAARVLADVPALYGGTWNRDGTILFASTPTSPIYRVSPTGDQRSEVTRVVSPQAGHRFPYFLPDGRHFLFFSTGTGDGHGVFVGSIDSADTKRLFDADSAALFAPPDYLLFSHQEELLAQRFNLATLTPIGEPVRVAERVANVVGTQGSIAVSASAAGQIVYRAAVDIPRQLIWFDRSGRQVNTVGELDPALDGAGLVKLAPGGRTVAVRRIVDGSPTLWLVDVERGTRRRFETTATFAWSSDGSRIAFSSIRQRGLADLYLRPVEGSGAGELLLESSENKNVNDWSSDDRFILYTLQSQKTGTDLWALQLADKKMFAVAQSNSNEGSGRFSPDGRWVTYTSNESGPTEVWVQPFPGPGRRLQVSVRGGTVPEWSSSGKEIFFLAPDRRFMAAPMTLRANGTADVGIPVPLATVSDRAGNYAAAPDGRRFLVNMALEDATVAPMTVILNWAGGRK